MNVGKGNLDTQVPEIKTDKELESLNKNFNLMIDRLKTQQDKLLLTERHEAWENVARKLAHEIKNPLAGIKGAAQIAKNIKNDYETSQECLSIIEKETTRLSLNTYT